MWHITPNSSQYVLQPSLEETKAVIEVLKRFERSLLDVPEPQPEYSRFFLGILPDEIVWIGDNPESYVGPRPSMGARLDIEEFGEGRLATLTPGGLHALMLGGAARADVLYALGQALHWERDRVANGDDPEVHLPSIQDNVETVVHIVWELCRTFPRRMSVAS
ncbi:hypothetical protein [Rhizobium sp. LCM 4573]|uniref:hypothetical protein n=1 Tax=Rhizobium sp. LCM 4573 TaxID=1848291 RepID=UPI0008D9106F|nr:hypothetical protein [Rhizobium sp. LCM 4573]OHV78670.1 hypothetical protein LCM4573_26225 [Rhizobium sp. LCM 4573]